MACACGTKRRRVETKDVEVKSDHDDGLTEKHCSDSSSVYTDKRLIIDTWSKLNDLRLNGLLCDVVLVSEEGVKQCAHRCVLSASSEYFSRMFEQSGFIDSHKQEIQLHGVPGEALIAILDCMYTGSLELTTTTVHAVVAASDYLLYPNTRQMCSMFMTKILASTLGSQEALRIVATAEQFEFKELVMQAWPVIHNNFKEIYLSDYFKELSRSEMKHILDLNGQYVPEETIWTAALSWLEYDPNERKEHLDEVLNSVRFPLLSTETLMDVVKKHELVQNSEHVRSLLDDAICYKLFPLRQSKMQTSQTVPRGSYVDCVFCLVGTQSFYVYKPKIKFWYSLACPSALELTEDDAVNFNFNLVLVDNKVYAIGKVRSTCETGRYVVNNIQLYDMAQNSWTEQSLPNNCENAIFVEWQKSLYVCSRSAVEVYNPAEKSWSVFCEHEFSPYDFLWADKGLLKFYYSTGTLLVIDASAKVSRERIAQSLNLGSVNTIVKSISAVKKDGVILDMLVTVKSGRGYSRKLLDVRTHQFTDATAFSPFHWDHWGHVRQEFPLCLDPNKFWHILPSRDIIWVMAAHLSILGKPGKGGVISCGKVCDGVVPFYCLKAEQQWERHPSIPEQPGKTISLCLYDGMTGTTVACSY